MLLDPGSLPEVGSRQVLAQSLDAALAAGRQVFQWHARQPRSHKGGPERP
jgi:hypothetical protein